MSTAENFTRGTLIGATIIASWLGMQAVHELGHVLGALLVGAQVENVALHPLTISRTDVATNTSPLVVVWMGPLVGVTLPLAMSFLAQALRLPGHFVLRFFAGFCLIANGAYLGLGASEGIGDCGDLLEAGAPIWHLWLFGGVTAPIGFYLWHGQAPHFGLGKQRHAVDGRLTAGMLVVTGLLIGLGLVVGK